MSEQMTEAPTTQEGLQTTEATTTDASTGDTTETTYANGKFKAVSDLENSYMELQKSYIQKLGKFDGAPEKYAIDESFQGNPTADALAEWGKNNQMNNEGLNSLLTLLNENDTKQAEAYRTQQMELLGKDADTRIKNATDWVNANLGEEFAEGLDSMWVGAKGVEAIERMMKLSQGTAPANVPATPAISEEQIRNMRFEVDQYGNRRMSSDPKFREKVLQLEAQMLGSTTNYTVAD